MPMKRLLLLLAPAALLAHPAAAQTVELELRGGASVGSYGATAAGRQDEPGPAFAATLHYAPVPRLSTYLGYSRSGFGCTEAFCGGAEVSLASSGVEGGVRWTLPLPLRPWLRAGIVSHSLALTATPEDAAPVRETTSRGFGVEAGAGVEVPLTPRISLAPGLRYLRYDVRSAADGSRSDGVAVLVGDVGLRVALF